MSTLEGAVVAQLHAVLAETATAAR